MSVLAADAVMKACVVGDDGPALKEIARPVVGREDVCIRVRAAALNRGDVILFSHTPGLTLGAEWSGEVVEVGADVVDFRPGDRVMAWGGGAFAEFASTHQGRVLPLPSHMTFEQGATLPVALMTMHDALVTQGDLAPGQAVLIQGASSGVGLLGLQIAKLLGAGLVVGSSTDPGRRARLGEFGADLAVDTSRAGWVEEVLQATGGEGVDLTVDQVSGSLASQTLEATRVKGRIVNVGRLGGARAEFDFDAHARRRITYVGVTFRTRTSAEVTEISRRMRADLWRFVESGELSLPIDGTFPLDQAGAALERMRRNQHFGKVLVLPN